MKRAAGQMDVLAWLAMSAAVVVSAHGEWALAVDSGFHPVVAAGLPLALDTYALRALRAGREVFPPVLGMIATNAAAHLLGAGVITPDWRLIVAVSAIAPLVLWRVHVLHTHTAPAESEPEAVVEDDLPPLWAEPVPAPAGPYPVDVPAVPGLVEVYPQPVPAVPETAPAPAAEPVAELEFCPLPPRPVPAPAPERTHPYPLAEYVPGDDEYTGYTSPDQHEQPEDLDELTPAAAERFAAVLADGALPSVRTLRAEYGIGQPRAQRVRDQLRTLQAPASAPIAA
ncbi:hypothetical protein ACIGZJ_09490 [Kitasatospora sp. NPDC052868]|uniref:hypothetical protein n=1 Tax=Kitasatospora sp. NPDC052868 TaxID=3364060 RepID=UPI0037CAEF30